MTSRAFWFHNLLFQRGKAAGSTKQFVELDDFRIAPSSLIALSLASGKSGVASSPVNFRYSARNSRSAEIFRIASRKMSARSFGVPGKTKANQRA